MPRPLAATLALLLALPAAAQAQQPRKETPPPRPPLELPAPPAPPARVGGLDLKTLDGQGLRARAYERYEAGALDEAIALQHWSILARQGGGEGHYNLACFYALARKVDAALYWLQRGAIEEGVDAAWAREDEDLAALRDDRRWEEVANFLDDCNAYWERSGRSETLLVVPAGYEVGRPVTAVVGLHGLGAHPRDFADPEDYQKLADRLGVAFLGVSGTTPLGPRAYAWSEDPARDAARVKDALASVADRVTVAPGRVVLVGFSQGAQVAAEVAARDPATFAGAIVLSPGSREASRLEQVAAAEAHAGRGFVVRVGAAEEPENVDRADEVTRSLRRLGARVDAHAYEGMDEHAFPPDYEERLGAWVAHCLGDRAP